MGAGRENKKNPKNEHIRAELKLTAELGKGHVIDSTAKVVGDKIENKFENEAFKVGRRARKEFQSAAASRPTNRERFGVASAAKQAHIDKGKAFNKAIGKIATGLDLAIDIGSSLEDHTIQTRHFF